MSGVGLVTVSERMSMSGKMDSVEVVVEEPYPVEDVDRQFVCKEDGSFAMCLNLDKRCNMMGLGVDCGGVNWLCKIFLKVKIIRRDRVVCSCFTIQTCMMEN